MRVSALLVGAALLFGTATSAFADTFNFSFTSTKVPGQTQDTGSGTFTTQATATSGEYLITGITGTYDGSKITGLIAPGGYPPFGFITNDNLLYYPKTDTTGFGAAFLDEAGVAFNVGPFNSVNFYFDGKYYEQTGLLGLGSGTLKSFTVTPTSAVTPEPSSLLLLGTGLLGAVGAVRRRLA